MIVFNTNVLSDRNAVSTNPDGGYNFSCVTSEENEVILSVLADANKYPPEQRGIALAFLSEGITYKPRYIINQIIVEYAKLVGSSLDIVAEFIAYSRKNSAYRAKAISAFEQLDRKLPSQRLVRGIPCIRGTDCT